MNENNQQIGHYAEPRNDECTNQFPPVTTGYVYVFNQTNQSITQEAYFYPSDALSNDQFGKSVAVFGDFIAVGSPLHDEGFSDSGAVYLYKKVNNVFPNQYAIRGFDVTFDAIVRVLQPNGFEKSATEHATQYLENKFDYINRTTSGYVNSGVYIMQYQDDYTVIELNKWLQK